MKQVSQLLSMAVDRDGKVAFGWNHEEVVELYARAFEEFEESPIGQELLRRGGDELLSRAHEICGQRYENASPMLVPFCETLDQVGTDLLNSLPPEPAPKVAPKPKSQPAPVAVPQLPEPDAKLRQFAFMVRDQLTRNEQPCGVSSLKPHAGVVTIAQNGHSYFYENEQFEKLYSEAKKFGLLF